MPIPRFLCAPPPNHEKSRRGLGGALIPAEVFTHWERPPAEAQGRRDGNWTTNRRRPRLHGWSTESPLCASAPLRENLLRSLCAPPIRASPPSNRSDPRREIGSRSRRKTGNGVRSVRLTFVLEALSRSCASARFQNLRIPCAAAASRTPRHPFQLLSPLTARTLERKLGQVHDAMPRSGTVESKRLSARQPFVKWTDLTPLLPFP